MIMPLNQRLIDVLLCSCGLIKTNEPKGSNVVAKCTNMHAPLDYYQEIKTKSHLSISRLNHKLMQSLKRYSRHLWATLKETSCPTYDR